MRGLLVLGATCLSLAVCGPALAQAQAPSPRDCATAWNRGASPAQKRAVLQASGARVASREGTSSCTITFVLPRRGPRVAIGAVVAGPHGRSGVWTLRRQQLPVAAAACKPNARLDRSGLLHLL